LPADGAEIDEGSLLLWQHQMFGDLCAHTTELGHSADHARLAIWSPGRAAKRA
jgi:hypothetical protein